MRLFSILVRMADTESASCGSEPAFLANAASSVMSVALASPTKVAWTKLWTVGQWTVGTAKALL